MNPEAVARVRATAAAAAADPRFASTFYECLFRRAPAVEAMFPSSLEDQERKFSDQLQPSCDRSTTTPPSAPMPPRLGPANAGYGVEARHYEIVNRRGSSTPCVTLGAAIDADTEASWRAALDLVAEEMQAGADPP